MPLTFKGGGEKSKFLPLKSNYILLKYLNKINLILKVDFKKIGNFT